MTNAIKPFTYYFTRFNEVTSWHKPYETGFALFVYVFCCYYQVCGAAPSSMPAFPNHCCQQLLLPAIMAWALALLARGYARKHGTSPPHSA